MTSEPVPIRRLGVARVDDEPVAIDRGDITLPPHNVQAEESVLGAVLKNDSAIARVSADLRPSDFYDVRHRHIWAAMLSLFERQQPIDYTTLIEELTRRGTYEQAGGVTYLSELSLSIPSAANVDHYSTIVRRHSFFRQQVDNAQKLANWAYRAEMSEAEFMQRANAVLAAAAAHSGGRKIAYPEEWVGRYMERLESVNEEGSFGISTGLLDLDNITLGLAPKNLVLLCARASVGKSELSGQIALDVARGYAPSGGRCRPGTGWVLHVSLEMGEEELAERATSSASGVDKLRLLRGGMDKDEYDRLGSSLGLLHESRLAFANEPGVTSHDVRALALQLEAEKGQIDLIIVDYLQLLTDKESANAGTPENLGKAAQRLHDLAGELNCCVLAPTQVGRQVDLRENKRPLLADLKDSGGLEQAADIVIAMYRDEMYDDKSGAKGVTELINRKHRRFGNLRGMTAKAIYARTRYVDMATI